MENKEQPKKTRTRKTKQQAAQQPTTQPALEQPAVQPAQNVEHGEQLATQPAAQPATQPVEKAPRKPRAPKEPKLTFDFVGAAIGKYAEGGWNVYRCTNGNINDFIAHREKKIHYVRVVPSNAAEDLRYHGESKNSFIQNAMSNAAIPVFASVKPVIKKGEEAPSGAAISLENVNDKTRVLIGKPTAK